MSTIERTISEPSVFQRVDASKAPVSQTLSRGIRILEILADAREPLTIDELARSLDLHRSIAYRLLRTLESHRLVERDAAGKVSLGARMAALATGIAHDLQSAALPELTAIAGDLGMTCFLVVLDQDECITLASVEPRHAIASVVQRPGARHSVLLGAPGKAILSIMTQAEWPDGASARLRAEVEAVRERGYATSHDEVISTVQSVSVPLSLRGRRPAAIAVIHVGTALGPDVIAERLTRSVESIREALGG
ncbi:MAG TPA: helix-turn-helix domain-containing protein [Terrimesophilobacter sp.]|nr:helix-turn-helix domain-containing protein [Terrimesophilobacter sp.]